MPSAPIDPGTFDSIGPAVAAFGAQVFDLSNDPGRSGLDPGACGSIRPSPAAVGAPMFDLSNSLPRGLSGRRQRLNP